MLGWISQFSGTPFEADRIWLGPFHGLVLENVRAGGTPIRRARVQPALSLTPKPHFTVHRLILEHPHIAPGNTRGLEAILTASRSGLLGSFDLREGSFGLNLSEIGISEIAVTTRAVWKKDEFVFPNISLKALGLKLSGSGRLVESDGVRRLVLVFSKIEGKTTAPAAGWRVEEGKIVLDVTLGPEPSVRAVLTDVRLSQPDRGASIAHLDADFTASASAVSVHAATAFVNDFPLGAKGSWKRGQSFEAELLTFPGQIPELRSVNPLNATVKLSATAAGAGWDTEAHLSRWALQPDKTYKKNESSVRIKGWEGSFRKSSVAGRAARIDVTHEEGAYFRKTSVENAELDTIFRRGILRWNLSEASFAGGKLDAHGFMRLARHRLPRWGVSARLAGVPSDRFYAEWGRAYPLQGALDADARVKGLGKNFRTAFDFKLRDGRIGPLPALDSLAENLGLESLRHLAFGEFTGTIESSSKETLYRGLKMENPDTRLSADAKFRQGIVSGKLLARFRFESLKQSSKLRWLVRFVGGLEWVDFDFEIAGSSKAVRVNWLTGDFKKRLESRLKPWMQRRLEREIERRFR